jgi:hypothetical protein
MARSVKAKNMPTNFRKGWIARATREQNVKAHAIGNDETPYRSKLVGYKVEPVYCYEVEIIPIRQPEKQSFYSKLQDFAYAAANVFAVFTQKLGLDVG